MLNFRENCHVFLSFMEILVWIWQKKVSKGIICGMIISHLSSPHGISNIKQMSVVTAVVFHRSLVSHNNAFEFQETSFTHLKDLQI